LSYFQSISLTNYRNFFDTNFYFDKGCNIIIGKNGSGKTNILESISLFEKGRGFRKDNIQNLINYQTNEKFFKISSIFNNNNNEIFVSVFSHNINEKYLKKILVNESSELNSIKYFGNLLSIIHFLPEMERLFVASPIMRRNFLDRLIYTNDKNYSLLISNYKKTLYARQQVLKKINYDEEWIANLEKNIASFGSTIYKKRIDYIDTINLKLKKLDVLKNYSNNIAIKIKDKFLLANKEIINDKERYIAVLNNNRKLDLLAGGCTIGPHRSDIIGYSIDNNIGINQFSTGQQKTVVLLIILAQCKFLIEDHNLKPIILLDEVCSHLDSDNRELLLHLTQLLDVQIFMTGTEKNFFSFLSTKAQYCNIT